MLNNLITCSSGIGAGDPACGDGPDIILASPQFVRLQQNYRNKFSHTLALKNNVQAQKLAAIPEIVRLNKALANTIKQLVQEKKIFTVLGGDHSCAMGTWSGVSAGLSQSFGLLWIDAHLDSHDPKSSCSLNVHGMPVATLLGKSDPLLSEIATIKPSILPEHIVLFGVRSYEPAELTLLNDLNVKIIFMDDIQKNGLTQSLETAIQFLQQKNQLIGITIDMDAFDPVEIPGVGSPEKNGICFNEFHSLFDSMIRNLPHLIGVEISEFNPTQDIENKTLSAIIKLLESILNREF